MDKAAIGNTRFLANWSAPTRGCRAGGMRSRSGVRPAHRRARTPVKAEPHEVSFIDNRRYAATLKETRAGAVMVHPNMQALVPKWTVPILTTEPHVAGPRSQRCSIR